MRVNLSVVSKITMTLLFLGVAFVWGEAVAQQSSDIEKVKAASQAVYAALNKRDISAMEKAWAHTAYVVHISPVRIFLGWNAVRESWEDLNNNTSKIAVVFSEAAPTQVEGKIAWEVGIERGQVTLKSGNVTNIKSFVTNIYQNVDGAWLMVSHQAGQIPNNR